MSDLDEVLRVRGDAVLGAEEGAQRNAAAAGERGRGVLEAGRYRRRVRDEPHSSVPDDRRVVEEGLEASADAADHRYSANCSANFAGGRPGRSIVPFTALPSSVPLNR